MDKNTSKSFGEIEQEQAAAEPKQEAVFEDAAAKTDDSATVGGDGLMGEVDMDTLNQKQDVAPEESATEASVNIEPDEAKAEDAMAEAQDGATEEAVAEDATVEAQKDEAATGDAGVVFDTESMESPAEAQAQTEEDSADKQTIDSTSVLAENSIIGAQKGAKKGRGRVFALVAVLILILAGCVGAYFLMQKPNEKKANNQGEEETQAESEYRLAGNDLSDFDLQFLKLEDKSENVIYSPLSIKYALAMLRDGADGDSKSQIDALIGDYKAKKYINSKNLSLANAMFINNDYKSQVIDSYIEGLKANYNAEVVFDSFANANTLNNWVSNKTLGLVKQIASDEEVSQLNYALVNALAIDQKWNYLMQCQTGSSVPCKGNSLNYSADYSHEKYNQSIELIQSNYPTMKFNDINNRKAVKIGASINKYDIIKELGEDKIKARVTEEYKKWLQTEAGQWVINDYKENPTEGDIDPTDVNANVDKYMKELKANYGKENSSTDFYLNDTEDAKVFAKDLKEYDGNTLQYVGIMPKSAKLKDFVKELTAEKATEYIKGLKELKKDNFKDGVVTRIDGTLPLFKYDYKLKLKEGLEELGVKDVFDSDKANLSKLSKSNSFIGVAKHKATIEFSNEGIKAGAASVVGGLGGGGYRFEYEWEVPVEKIDLTFDKPFLYLIRDKNTGEVWFTGTVYQPIENK